MVCPNRALTRVMDTSIPSSSSEVVSVRQHVPFRSEELIYSKLVLALYEPSPPHVISHVQGTLHRIQKSPSAWLIARDLLGHGDDKVKFFGALTIIVKLNTERSVKPCRESWIHLIW